MVPGFQGRGIYQSTPLGELSTNLQEFLAAENVQFFRKSKGGPFCLKMAKKSIFYFWLKIYLESMGERSEPVERV